MRLSSCLFPASILCAASGAFGQVCLPANLEVLILQDVSDHWSTQLRSVGRSIRRVMARLELSYRIKYGIAHFIDKPNVGVGIGNYGGYPDGRKESWCYQTYSPMQDAETAMNDWNRFLTSLGYESGQDFDESQFEALQRAVLDESVGWSTNPATKKIIWLITDSSSHDGSVNGKRLSDAITRFNGNWVCQSDLRTSTFRLTGGFGATHNVPQPISLWTSRPDVYQRAGELNIIRGCRFLEMDRNQVATYIDLYNQLQPTWAMPARPYNLTRLRSAPEDHCRENEYPNGQQVDAILANADTQLFVTIVGGDSDDQYRDTVDFWESNLRNSFTRTRSSMVAIPQEDIFTFQSVLVQALIDFLPKTDCA